MNSRLSDAIVREAERIGANPHDFATVISYETGGTFDPWQKGPTTQWGVHRGLIQMGEPQRQEFGYYEGMPIEDAVKASADYLVKNGFQPGMGLLDMYSTINAGAPGLYDRSDANNGGAPGTVRDKVNDQMEGHKAKASALLGGQWQPSPDNYFEAPAGQTESAQMSGTTYADVTPSTRATIAEVAQQPKAPEAFNWFEAVGANLASSSMTGAAVRSWSEGAMDPTWTVGEQRGMEVAKQTPEMYHDYLFGAPSEPAFNQRLKWVQEDMGRQERIQAGSWGWADPAALVAGVVDPIPLAIGVATGGLGGAAVKGGFLARGAVGAVSGAAIGAATDYVSQEAFDDPYADPLMAGGMGALFGAFGGALSKGGDIRGADVAYQARAEMVRQGIDPNATFVGNKAASGGAAFNTSYRDPLINEEAADAIQMAEQHVPTGFGGKMLRQDVTGQMTTSSNPLVRLIGSHFFDETAGFKDHSVVPDSANTRFTALHRQMVGNFNVEYVPARDAYVREGNLFRMNLVGRAKRELEFNTMVGEYIDNPIKDPNANPHVVKAASVLEKNMGIYANLMNEHGLWGGGADKNYLPKVANHERIAEIDRDVHPDAMRAAIFEAIKKHSPTLDDEIAERMAAGYWNNIRKAGFGIDDGLARSLHLSDRQAFIDSFYESVDNRNLLTDEQITQVYELLTGAMENAKSTTRDGSNGVGYLKKRTLLDYNEPLNVKRRDGTIMAGFRVRDLFEQDAEMLYRRYARSMSGRLAFAQTKITNPSNGKVIANGIRNETDLAKLIQQVKESYRDMPGDYNANQRRMENDIKNIEFGWKRINGVPVFDQANAFAQWSRRLKTMQFIRLMSNMGLNQVQEAWKLISLTGFRASMSQLPAISTMVKGVKAGGYQRDQLLNELADMTGIGLDNLYNRFNILLDEDRIGSGPGGKITRAIDNTLDFGQQLTASASFMRSIHDYQQRWALKAITQQMAAIGRKARTAGGEFDWGKVKQGDKDRLASMGLGEVDAKMLFRNLLDNSEFDGNKITSVNTTKWDAEAIGKFRLFLGRYTDRLVQQNDFGALSKWMSNPVASMFVQFRSFVYGAFAKSTLWSINHGAFKDPRMMVMLLGEIAAGTATYMIRQAGNLSNEEGYQKFMEEASDPIHLAKQGWARTATASVIPMFLDTLLQFGPDKIEVNGEEIELGPQFGQARASGSPTDAWLGTPVVDQIGSAAQFSSGALEALMEGRSMTKGEVKSGVRAFVPLGNWVPFTAAMGALIKDLPDRAN